MRRRRQAPAARPPARDGDRVSVSGGSDHAVPGPSVDEVAPGVFVATAHAYTTTTTVIAGDDGRCLLIDPAVSVAELAALAGWLGERGLRPAVGWSTHPHWDHLLWSRALGNVPRYATPRAAAVAARERSALVAAVKDEAPGHDLALFGQVEALPGDEIGWQGPRAVVYPHDAHAPGHGAVFLPDSGVLIVGDMCSDIEIPLPDFTWPGAFTTDDLASFFAGLNLLPPGAHPATDALCAVGVKPPTPTASSAPAVPGASAFSSTPAAPARSRRTATG